MSVLLVVGVVTVQAVIIFRGWIWDVLCWRPRRLTPSKMLTVMPKKHWGGIDLADSAGLEPATPASVVRCSFH